MTPSIVNYWPVAILAALGALTIAGVLKLSNIITPRRPTAEKLSTYECGETPIGDIRIPIDIKYYIYVLIFLVMDIEVVFLIPWAVEFKKLGAIGFAEMMLFVFLLLIGWGYAWKKGVLKWLQ